MKMQNRKYVVVAMAAIAITAMVSVGIASVGQVYAQGHTHHCFLPNGNPFPGQGGFNSNPISQGGGCPNGLSN